MRSALIIPALLLAVSPAFAHGVFWQTGPDAWTLMEGHLPGHEHGGDAASPCEAAPVTVLMSGVAEAGALSWTEAPVTEPVRVPAAAAAFALIDWGWWTKTAEGTRNVHPGGVSGVLKAWSSRETVKHLAAWPASADKPVGRGLEILPTHDPFAVKPGGKLRFVVTLDGRPVADAAVSYDGRVRGASGPDGAVRLKLREPGLQQVQATLRRPAADPAWAEDVQTATLTFVMEAR